MALQDDAKRIAQLINQNKISEALTDWDKTTKGLVGYEIAALRNSIRELTN